jgi:hypothetical protein
MDKDFWLLLEKLHHLAAWVQVADALHLFSSNIQHSTVTLLDWTGIHSVTVA